MQKTNKLKDQFTLRIYNQEDKDVLDKAYERNKYGFDNISDFIRYCVITGAEKLLGDSEVDQRLNLNEIKQQLTEINENLKNFNFERKQDHKEQSTSSLVIQKMVNFIANAAWCISHDKKVKDDIDEGLFYLEDLELDCIKEINDRS